MSRTRPEIARASLYALKRDRSGSGKFWVMGRPSAPLRDLVRTSRGDLCRKDRPTLAFGSHSFYCRILGVYRRMAIGSRSQEKGKP